MTKETAFGVSGSCASLGLTDGTSQFCITSITDGQQRDTFDRTDYIGTELWRIYTGGENLAATGVLLSLNSDGFTIQEVTAFSRSVQTAYYVHQGAFT